MTKADNQTSNITSQNNSTVVVQEISTVTPPSKSSVKKEIPVTPIVGAIGGAVVLIAAIVGLILFLRKKKQSLVNIEVKLEPSSNDQ
jgi:beta-lactamase regulating signal transducer with metallopeptidase domain